MSKDDDKLEKELKEALKAEKDAEPIRRAARRPVVKEAFRQATDKGKRNGEKK